MKILKKIKNFWDDESGMGVVEVVLIIIVLVGLVMLFKKQITSLVNMLLSKMSSILTRLVICFLNNITRPTRTIIISTTSTTPIPLSSSQKFFIFFNIFIIPFSYLDKFF